MPRDASDVRIGDDRSLLELDCLRRGQWFGGLPAALQALILARSMILTFAKRAHIQREREHCRGLCAVISGRVHVVREIGESSETLMHVGEAGFWFGEHASLGAAPAVSSVVAATPSRILVLPLAEFERIVADEPRYFRLFAELLIERYAISFRHLSESKGLAAEEWLRIRLRDLAEMRRRDAPCDGPIDFAVSQAELATMIGVSRQTLCMLLGRLQDRGLVEVRYKSIRVFPPSRDVHSVQEVEHALGALAAASGASARGPKHSWPAARQQQNQPW